MFELDGVGLGVGVGIELGVGVGVAGAAFPFETTNIIILCTLPQHNRICIIVTAKLVKGVIHHPGSRIRLQ